MPPPPSKRAALVRNTLAATTYSGFDYPTAEEINKPPSSINGYIRCIFGRKGAGKSTLAAQFPKALTLMFEPRRRGLEIRQVNIQKQTATQIMDGGDDVWAKIVNSVDRWIEDPSIDNLNFDSIDIAYECCVHHICAKNRVSTPGDAGKAGPDIWMQIRDEWATFFDTLAATRLGINMLSHMKSRESEEMDGGKFQRRSPSCSPACLLYIKQAVDLVFYYGTLQGKRIMQLRDDTGEAEVAVGPAGRFMQPDGKPIYYLQMPEGVDNNQGYQTLSDAFNNMCWDAYTPEDQRGVKPPPAVKGPPRKK